MRYKPCGRFRIVRQADGTVNDVRNNPKYKCK